jgi:hypothetical protein
VPFNHSLILKYSVLPIGSKWVVIVLSPTTWRQPHSNSWPPLQNSSKKERSAEWFMEYYRIVLPCEPPILLSGIKQLNDPDFLTTPASAKWRAKQSHFCWTGHDWVKMILGLRFMGSWISRLMASCRFVCSSLSALIFFRAYAPYAWRTLSLSLSTNDVWLNLAHQNVLAKTTWLTRWLDTWKLLRQDSQRRRNRNIKFTAFCKSRMCIVSSWYKASKDADPIIYTGNRRRRTNCTSSPSSTSSTSSRRNIFCTG